MSRTVTLAELGIDPADDAGTTWHPRADKAEAWTPSGLLRDLDDEQVREHRAKPEAADQIDAARPMAAEDSAETPEGVV